MIDCTLVRSNLQHWTWTWQWGWKTNVAEGLVFTLNCRTIKSVWDFPHNFIIKIILQLNLIMLDHVPLANPTYVIFCSCISYTSYAIDLIHTLHSLLIEMQNLHLVQKYVHAKEAQCQIQFSPSFSFGLCV